MLKLKSITKDYDKKRVLDDFSHTFNDYGIYAVIGESGKGKTTLLNIIAGLDKDFTGEIEKENRKFSMVFQEDRLLPGLNVIKNVMFVNGDKEKALNALEIVGLKGEENSRLSSLSGGMLRRVSIARALCADYDVLLMDEPFSSIDKERKTSIMDVIKIISKDHLVIFVTHDISEAEYLKATVIRL